MLYFHLKLHPNALGDRAPPYSTSPSPLAEFKDKEKKERGQRGWKRDNHTSNFWICH